MRSFQIGERIRWKMRTRSLLILSTLVILAACQRSGGDAGAESGQMPAIGPSRPMAMTAPIERQLANGLRIVVLPRAGSALVAAEFLVLAGGEIDPPDRAGLADFTASLLTQGSQAPGAARSASQIAAAAEALGGSLHAQAGWDSSRIGITVTKGRLASALDLLAEVVRYPSFSGEEVSRHRRQAIDSLRLSFSDPAELTPLVARRVVYGLSPYGHPRLGTPASLQRITADDLRKLHRRFYRPERAVLILSGGFDPDTALALAGQVFGDWTVEVPATAIPPVSAGESSTSASITVVDVPDSDQASVIVAAPLPGRLAPDYYPGLVASTVLGGGYSARLNSEIRIKRGLSYGARAEYGVLRTGGAWMASAQTGNPTAAEVLALIRAEVQRLIAEPTPADELAVRKLAYTGSFARRLETVSGVAASLAAPIAQGQPADEITRVMTAVEAVTADEVRSWASRHLKADALRVVIVGDAKQFIDALPRDGATIDVIPHAELDLETANLRRIRSERR